jgi:hypothetical protein
MSQRITVQEADSILEEVVKRAQSDLEFRQLCLSDPNSATKKVTDKDIPEGFKLRFVENQGADLTVVLPDLIDANAELSDEELEQVAGGNKKDCKLSCAASCGVSSGPLPNEINVTFN